LERAVEGEINMVAVANGCRRQIAPPRPPVIFVATNDAGWQWLAEKTGLQHGPLKATAFRNRDRMELDAKILNELKDREDGFALMAEALATGHATAQFHEFVRLLSVPSHGQRRSLSSHFTTSLPRGLATPRLN
jgi:hypothetical protein